MSNWIDVQLDVLASSPEEINQIERALQEPCEELLALVAKKWEEDPKEIDRLDRSTTRESAQIKEKAAQLSPPIMDLDALALMSLPAKDVIDEYRVTKETLEGERAILQGNLDEATQNLPVLQAQVDELAGGQLASAPEIIATLR